jgi:hypothetical protein
MPSKPEIGFGPEVGLGGSEVPSNVDPTEVSDSAVRSVRR